MSDLGLQAQVQRHFNFLVSEKGFECTESTPYRVRFESVAVFIELVFDGHRSYEVGLLIGKINSKNLPFSINEILRLRRAPESFLLTQATTEKALAASVAKLAQALRIYGSDFIAGKESSFVEVEELRQRECRQYALDRDLRMARTKAEVAWHKKDYATVIKVLKPLRSALTASEVGKLEFAEKQCGWLLKRKK